MGSWLEFPAVEAPGSDDRDKTVRYGISSVLTEGYGTIDRYVPIFQMWTHVVGKLPPINNISRVMRGELKPSLITLKDAVGCFQGIKRPHDDEDDGSSVLVYVLNPSVTLVYYADMVCLASPKKVPDNVVLTVQVRPQPPLLGDQTQLNGVITRLEFVFSDPNDRRFPVDFNDRYAQTLWRNT